MPGTGHPVRVPEPVQIKPGLPQRFDLMAVANPRSIRRSFWFFGLLGLWSLIGAVSSLAVAHWVLAAMALACAAGNRCASRPTYPVVWAVTSPVEAAERRPTPFVEQPSRPCSRHGGGLR
jgi:hypothetical protein